MKYFENTLNNCADGRQRKTIPVTLQAALLALIIVHLQMHPSLNLPSSTIIQCIFKIFQIIDDFPRFYFSLFLIILINYFGRSSNGRASVKKWDQLWEDRMLGRVSTNQIIFDRSKKGPCRLFFLLFKATVSEHLNNI